MTIPETIGERLHRIRRRQGLSCNKLEELSGIDASSISKYERGITDPRWTSVESLLIALGVEIEFIETK